MASHHSAYQLSAPKSDLELRKLTRQSLVVLVVAVVLGAILGATYTKPPLTTLATKIDWSIVGNYNTSAAEILFSIPLALFSAGMVFVFGIASPNQQLTSMRYFRITLMFIFFVVTVVAQSNFNGLMSGWSFMEALRYNPAPPTRASARAMAGREVCSPRGPAGHGARKFSGTRTRRSPRSSTSIASAPVAVKAAALSGICTNVTVGVRAARTAGKFCFLSFLRHQ